MIKKFYYILSFIGFYLYKLVEANIKIALDIITPKLRVEPDFITIPLHLKSKFGLLMFSNLVSMTPGTLSVDILNEKKMLLVHVLYKQDEREILAELDNIQHRIKKITE